MAEYQVDQQVLVVKRSLRHGGLVPTGMATIIRLGRRWGELSTGDRFDQTTGQLEGERLGAGLGFVVPDPDAWRAEQLAGRIWREFTDAARRDPTRPADLQPETIVAAARMVGFALPSAGDVRGDGEGNGEGNGGADSGPGADIERRLEQMYTAAGNSIVSLATVREMLAAPEWETRTSRVHNWRTYIPDAVRALWPTLDEVARMALYLVADEASDRETWE